MEVPRCDVCDEEFADERELEQHVREAGLVV
jgi:hypothetical protein